jgi:uncharacterized protein (TIGR02301 family)
MIRALLIAASLLALPLPAAAQTGSGYPAEPLAGLLGEMHALNYHCRTARQQYWRSRVQEMIDLEAPQPGAYRERLIASFNRGFQYYNPRRVRCGAEAEQELQALAARARPLAEQMRQTYIQ